ncbi:hypothetical protein BaRGS_00033508 [Batillaria attramentaria]|uniref:Extracellular membrane protein CFEM domain-containing protein n=1 Tax=Batillaria attramentaria TaxID=370345 RepID=A0ABD0JLC6_9CAEN
MGHCDLSPKLRHCDATVTEWDDLVCYCECDQPPVILEAETLAMTIDEKVDKIVKELQVNPQNTSSTRRKKESAEDSRTSAQGIGFVGVAFMAIVFGGILLLDLNVFISGVSDIYKAFRRRGQSDC